MTKNAFLAAYRKQLLARYPWAQDPAKRARYMASVAGSLLGAENTWHPAGEAVTAAWRDIGGKGKPSFKALRAMPIGESVT